MSLEVHAEVHAGAFVLQCALRVEQGGTVAVVGPNGAGKTTLLHAIAGLHRIGSGRIACDGVVFDEPARRTWLAPERRDTAVVFQDVRLFPHLSVRDNVSFGPRARGAGRRAARLRADAALESVGLAHRASARPGTLSGGEAKRVALARAIASRANVLLLDEPLSAVDAAARRDLVHLLQDQLRDHAGVALVVTHDPDEAEALADRVLVLDTGRVVDDDTVPTRSALRSTLSPRASSPSG